jgi:hypothetical protein
LVSLSDYGAVGYKLSLANSFKRMYRNELKEETRMSRKQTVKKNKKGANIESIDLMTH